MYTMGVPIRPSVSRVEKPLPCLPHPSSPTLTNPDMVLPDNLPDDISLSSLPRSARPPSPSYLVDQRQQAQQQLSRETANYDSNDLTSRRPPYDRSRTLSGKGAAVQNSPARRLQYRSVSDVAMGSPQNLAVPAMTGIRRGRFVDDGRWISIVASSISSEDLDTMRIPDFAGLDDDTETLDDEFDLATPSERWHAGEQMEPPETEESVVTLMRAELILANAKKRLNLYHQNLRGAREVIAPLTAANLKRATSLSSAIMQSAQSGRARYISRQPSDVRSRQKTDRPQSGEILRHSRVFSDPAPSPTSQEPSRIPLGNNVIPVSRVSHSWTANPLRGSRSQEQLKTGERVAQRPSLRNSPEPQLETLLENETSDTAESHIRPVPHRASTATDLQEQMHELRERISTLKMRAREDSLRRRSIQSLRQPCPLVDSHTTPSYQEKPSVKTISYANIGKPPVLLPDNPSPPLTEDGELVFDPQLGYTTVSPRRSPVSAPREPVLFPESRALDFGDIPSLSDDDTDTETFMSETCDSSSQRTVTDVSGNAEADSIYEDARAEPVVSQRHEDREDAFDYENFFLHSSLGTLSRPRGTSITSTDSGETAKGPSTFDQVPPTPETPETLREIERGYHSRSLSIQSTNSIASFATAQEATRHTPSTISEWLIPRSKHDRMAAIGEDYADTDVGIADQMATKMTGLIRSRSQSIRHAKGPSVSSTNSQVSVSVSALSDGKAQSLSLEDKVLVCSVVERLKQICEKLSNGNADEQTNQILRQRLDDAKKILDGNMLSSA